MLAAATISPASMADIEPIVVRQIYLDSVRRGADADGLLRGLGFGAVDLEHDEFRVSAAQTRRVILRALLRPEEGGLAFRLGSSFNPVCWGLALVGLMASSTQHDLLRFAVDFLPPTRRLLDVHWEMHGEDLVVLAEPLYDDVRFNGFLVEYTFAALVRVVRFTANPRFAPTSAAMRHRADMQAAGAALGCDVATEHAANLLVTAADGQPVPTAEPMVARMCRRTLTLRQRAGGGQSELADAVLRAARANLRSPPAAPEFAAELNIGERTLRRRLAQEGTSFNALVDRARRQTVTVMLRSGHGNLDEVAAACGFADARSLRRAFKRWTGQTPSQVRAQATG